jgi:hypothetical protein
MAIYDPTEDKKLEVEKPYTQVVAWSLNIVWDNGMEDTITDIPDWCASTVDDFLTDLEEEARIDQGLDGDEDDDE